MNWTPERIEQLRQLQKLLNVGISLDSSNNIISNITSVIEICESLSEFDLFSGKDSFPMFLTELVIQEREG